VVLEISELDAGYGKFQALSSVDLGVDEGETVAVIGANGAGKTTLMNAVAGVGEVWSGEILFDNRSIAGLSPHQRVELGISLVPEGRRLFASLDVRENLLVGAHSGRSGPWNLQRVVDLFPLLEPLLNRSAGQLSGGEQQAVAIGRALMSNPRLLLVDELSLGLAPVVVRRLYDSLPLICAEGTTILLVEQDVGQALSAADHISCLLTGSVSLSGRATDFSREAVTTAYFGVDSVT